MLGMVFWYTHLAVRMEHRRFVQVEPAGTGSANQQLVKHMQTRVYQILKNNSKIIAVVILTAIVTLAVSGKGLHLVVKTTNVQIELSF
jgi:hypothetical protein